MENIQLTNCRYLEESACQKLLEAYLLYRACFDKLASRALTKKQARFKLRPKQHMLEHLVLDFVCDLRLNPRYDANYLGEDMVRRVKALAISSHPSHLSRHVFLKYAMQVCLRYRSP